LKFSDSNLFQKTQSFLRLPYARKVLFFQVVGLSMYREILFSLGSKNAFTENLLKEHVNPEIANLSMAQQKHARDIAVAIELGRKYIPWKNLCRHQAWQTVVLLQKAGVPFSYHVGIKKEGPKSNEGHAWVMVHGKFISGKCKLSEYREIKF
jgi:hypothetical protein